jgi:hypothetical protein
MAEDTEWFHPYSFWVSRYCWGRCWGRSSATWICWVSCVVRVGLVGWAEGWKVGGETVGEGEVKNDGYEDIGWSIGSDDVGVNEFVVGVVSVYGEGLWVILFFKRESGRVACEVDEGWVSFTLEWVNGKIPSSKITCVETNTLPMDVSRQFNPRWELL